jgi:poly(beta-D-mannuronate) lyase
VTDGGVAAGLRSALDPAERRATVGQLIENQLQRQMSCPQPPPAVTDLTYESAYRSDDPTQSAVDAGKAAQYRKRAEDLRMFKDRVNRMADAYIGIRPRDARIAQCIASWLDTWATGHALVGGAVTAQGNAERKWNLVSFALDYMLLADAAEVPAIQREHIEAWLGEVARAWLEGPDYGLQKPNNHLNWGALALIAAGVAVRDDKLFRKGLELARTALDQIAEDGSLPLELARGTRAVVYQAYALEPLIVAAELAAPNGVDLYAERGGALHRLVRFTTEAMRQPSMIAQRVGEAQEWAQSYAAVWGWAFAYTARFPDPKLKSILATRRGALFYHPWFGDMSLRFGPKTDQSADAKR